MKKMWYQVIRRWFPPKYKGEYQFGSPIVGLYTYDGLLVVATKMDIYVSEDGVTYERVDKV